MIFLALGALAGTGGAVLGAYSHRQKRRDSVLTQQQLQYVVPTLPPERAELLLPYLLRAAGEFKLTPPEVLAAFLGQVVFESAYLKSFEEYASGAAYEGRDNLGNTQPGDGVRFKGRGAIQLTGRANYTEAGKALKLDLVGHPELAASLPHAFRVSGYYWNSRNLSALCTGREDDFRRITLKVNGADTTYPPRALIWRRARVALGLVKP